MEKSCRLIDDALEGGQSMASGSQYTHIPADLDAWANQCRAAQDMFPSDQLSQFTSYFAKAFKQVPNDPTLAHLAAITQWCPDLERPVFLVGRTQFFGGKSCPVNFARIPDWCCHCVANLAGVPASHCVDDVLVVERTSVITEGWLVWRALAALAGWDVPDRKSPLPGRSSRVLGARSDLSRTPAEPPTLSIEADRVDQLINALTEVKFRKSLGAGLAGKLWGRLAYSCTQLFGRYGRAKLRPFSRHQHEPGRYKLNPQLLSLVRRSQG